MIKFKININLLICCLVVVFANTNIVAQSKVCSRSSLKECAAAKRTSIEASAKVCPFNANAMLSSAPAGRIIDLPTCCYNKLTLEGKPCCAGFRIVLASAKQLIDVDGNKLEMKTCSYAKRAFARNPHHSKVASVLMVREKSVFSFKEVVGAKKACKMICSGVEATKA